MPVERSQLETQLTFDEAEFARGCAAEFLNTRELLTLSEGVRGMYFRHWFPFNGQSYTTTRKLGN